MGSRSIYSTFGTGRGMTDRGSRRRLRRIRMRDHWSIEMWILIVIVILEFVFVIPRLAEYHERLHHPAATQR